MAKCDLSRVSPAWHYLLMRRHLTCFHDWFPEIVSKGIPQGIRFDALIFEGVGYLCAFGQSYEDIEQFRVQAAEVRNAISILLPLRRFDSRFEIDINLLNNNSLNSKSAGDLAMITVHLPHAVHLREPIDMEEFERQARAPYFLHRREQMLFGWGNHPRISFGNPIETVLYCKSYHDAVLAKLMEPM